MSAGARTPVAFIGHGSPMNTLEQNRHTQAWRAFGARIPKPRAILAVSAHWYVPETAVTAMETPRTIHDFRGFPPALHAFDYPARGNPALARRIVGLLAPLPVRLDNDWGLDHGTWSVLAHMFPDADVPVVQLAIDRREPNQFHFDLGRRLAPLRDEGVLILGSGDIVHNLGAMRMSPDVAPYPWATRFNHAFRARLDAGDDSALIDYETLDEDALLSVPTPEHYLPALYVLGARRDDDVATVLTDGIELASIGMLGFMLGAPD